MLPQSQVFGGSPSDLSLAESPATLTNERERDRPRFASSLVENPGDVV